MRAIFFYGLFMDQSVLAGKGLHPDVLGPAVLSDYRIHIGHRATLLPAPGHRAYGVVMELASDEARVLYAEPSVREYVAERVRVERLDSGGVIEADCYNLPRGTGVGGTNPTYANALSRLVESLGFDAGYVREVAAFGD